MGRTRRWSIVVTVAAVGALLGPSVAMPARAADPAPASGADAFRYVREYAGLGLHRTGTAGNTTTAAWLAQEFEAIGLDTSTQGFSFPSYTPHAASVRVGSFSPEVFPLYYSGRTGPSGVSATLVDVGLGTPVDFALHPVAGKLALVTVPMPLPGLTPTFTRALEGAMQAGARGVVAIIQGSHNFISVPDVDAEGGMCTLPTLLVANNDGKQLRALAGQRATFTLDATYAMSGDAPNVLGVLPGTSDDVIVIGTPITGWFAAATERGAGIGAMLTLARYFAARADGHQLKQTIMFVGTSGHEVGFLGLEKFVEANPALAPRVTAYLHFGAAVGAKGNVALGNLVVPTGPGSAALLHRLREPHPRRGGAVERARQRRRPRAAPATGCRRVG